MNAPNKATFLLCGLLEKVYAKCLEKTCREIIEPKLDDTQCGFRHRRRTTDQTLTFDQIFVEPW